MATGVSCLYYGVARSANTLSTWRCCLCTVIGCIFAHRWTARKQVSRGWSGFLRDSGNVLRNVSRRAPSPLLSENWKHEVNLRSFVFIALDRQDALYPGHSTLYHFIAL